MKRGTRFNNKVASRARYLALLRAECDKWNVDFDKANSPSRVSKCAYVRGQVFRELTRQGFGLSGIAYPARCHHTTILHCLQRDEAKELAFLAKHRETPTPNRIISGKRLPNSGPQLITHRYLEDNYGKFGVNSHSAGA